MKGQNGEMRSQQRGVLSERTLSSSGNNPPSRGDGVPPKAHPETRKIQVFRRGAPSIACLLSPKDEYVLGPSIVPVSENAVFETFNLTFELFTGVTDYGSKSGTTGSKSTSRKISTPCTKSHHPTPWRIAFNFHEGYPICTTHRASAIIGIYGMLPGDNVDKVILENVRQDPRNLEFQKNLGVGFPDAGDDGSPVGAT